MLPLATDENFDNDVVRGLLRGAPELDLIRIQDAGRRGVDDRTILDWAARQGRVLLTHDSATVIRYAYERVRAGLPMAGVCEVRSDLPIGQAIEEILLLAECSNPDEWEGQVRYLLL